jgi:hypothetical protein
LEETIEACIELLNQDGINSKQVVKEILQRMVKRGG